MTTEMLGPVNTRRSPYARLKTLPLGNVHLGSGFWTRRQDTNYRVSLKHAYKQLEKAGNFHNFRLAIGRVQGQYRGRNFMDENVYKWLEAAAYALGNTPDAELQQMADEAIELITTAQQPDGYLNTYFITVEPDHRWTDLDHGHELYCAGHLFQAAVAWSRVLGDSRLLNVARRLADHIASIFGPDKRPGAPGHPEVEMALVELYRETGEPRYLNLAKFFIDQRGKGKMRGLGWLGPEYHQDRVPVRQATELEGHAVRAMYLMSGVTDLYLETGEPALLEAMRRLWYDLTAGKMHVTGGVGARYEGESFGAPYELPNDQCYCETCAAIGSLMWNWRLLLATGEPQFADVMEQTLYNGILSGPALDGAHFFYMNPLLSRGGYARREWYEVACCPPNIMRLIGSVQHYLATTDDSGVQLHHYSPATITADLPSGQQVTLRLETEYPWQGDVQITVEQAGSSAWALRLRVPGWCEGASLQLNGELLAVPAEAGSYAVIERQWQPGDTVTLHLPMTPHFLEAHPFIECTRGSVAIRRGPFIYCIEQVDQAPGVDIMAAQVDETAPLVEVWDADLLGGIMTIQAQGYVVTPTPWIGKLYKPLGGDTTMPRQRVVLKAIPYYVWGNRGAGPMRVWIPRGG